ncbi:GNAT family N-acetyltransferase [Kocuria sabuli]|uniref:GNAT family N-acetyltransferase n=1 Tax=Kocuria sabuli TaxID=3071448 RepID=UPI0034D468E8
MVLWSGRSFTRPPDRGQRESCLRNDQCRYWTGLHPASGKPAGHAPLPVDGDSRMMRLGCILLDPAARGRGPGRELISTAVRTGFELTELPAMKLRVYAHHGPAGTCVRAWGSGRPVGCAAPGWTAGHGCLRSPHVQ